MENDLFGLIWCFLDGILFIYIIVINMYIEIRTYIFYQTLYKFIINVFFQPRQLYKYTMGNLTFSSEYRVGIRAINTKNMLESGLFWLSFKSPSCIEWHNYNFNICRKFMQFQIIQT